VVNVQLWHTNPFDEVRLTRAEGCTVWDAAGKPYLDLLSGTWCSVLGRAHPRWLAAVLAHASTFTHAGSRFVTTAIEEAMAQLSEILPPGLNRAVFLSSGSEAVELALKMARAASGRKAVVVAQRGYYGATMYALALSEAGRPMTYLPALEAVYRLPAPHCGRCPMGRSWPCDTTFPCLDELAALADQPDRDVAAVLYEPVMAGGIFAPPLGYGARLRELTSRCGALLIAEEVTTGMGRTGRWFGFEHEGILPDILVIGKAIGGGLPVSVVVTSDTFEVSCRDRLGRHVQSHQNDPFSGGVAAAVIATLQHERLVEAAAARGQQMMSGLDAIRARVPAIRDVRGRGAMIGVELVPECAEQGPQVVAGMFGAGFIIDFHPASSTFRLFPPFVISPREVDSFLHSFERVLVGRCADPMI
jgi:4-aminobutyrate aminotransferase-like enzyme